MRSTRAGSTWRQVRLPDNDIESYKRERVIENICIVCDDINNNYCEHEDLNGDGDDDDNSNNIS